MKKLKKEILEKLRKIKLIVSDVDGVLTNGKINLLGDKELKIFDAKESERIQMAIRSGIPVVWLTGRKGPTAILRSESIGAHIMFKKDFKDGKSLLADALRKKFNVRPQEIIFVGDDWGDLCFMRQFGLCAAPSDASRENKAIADIITDAKGGEGVLSELIELIMRLQGKWNIYIKEYYKRFL